MFLTLYAIVLFGQHSLVFVFLPEQWVGLVLSGPSWSFLSVLTDGGMQGLN